MVTDLGHEAVGIATGLDAAIRMAEAKRPDIALVDYRLKGHRDGVKVALQLRKLGVKIIYVTASADEVRLINGVAEIVPKPLDKLDLSRAVQRVIGSAEREPPPAEAKNTAD
jgi:CheY-like chemotaxis protein